MAISIKDTNLFIDIEQKRLRSTLNLKGCEIKLHIATLVKGEDIFTLTSVTDETIDYQFSSIDLQTLYQFDWFSEEIIGINIL